MTYDFSKRKLAFPNIMFHGWVWEDPRIQIMDKINKFLTTKIAAKSLYQIWSNKSIVLYRVKDSDLTNSKEFPDITTLQRFSAGWYYRSTVENYNRQSVSPESILFLDGMIKYFQSHPLENRRNR